MTKFFPLIEVEGDAAQRGCQYGSQTGEQISVGIDIYKESFSNSGIEWHEAVNLAHEFIPEIEKYNKDFLIEMEGIASGSEQPLEHIVILNARTELLFWKSKKQPKEMQEECTAMLALPIATKEGNLLHGQNWDWNPKCENSSVVLKIHNEDGPDILTFVEAGQLARSGMNSDGIALTANGLHSDQDYGRTGIPNPFIRRTLFNQQRLATALFTITQAEISFSHFLLVSHCGGEAVGLETTPDDVFWMQPENGILSHANHFKIPAALANIKDMGLRRTPETIYRDSRVYAALKENYGNITIETFKDALADDYGKPDSVLRHPGVRPGGSLSTTVASIIMDTTAKKMWIARSPYKGIEYKEYGF
ncbi:MAG: hypothetical protein JKY84_13880 [Emcibacteraceae bacterium]|nr:hypothetical protein [Emcibacteraceae bacterium]